MLSAGIATLVFLLSSVPAFAGVVTFNDRAAWEAITGPQTDIDFESFGLTPGQATNFSTPEGLTVNGVNFKGTENGAWFLWLGNPGPGDPENFLSGARLRGPGNMPNSYLLASFPPLVNAFAIDLASGAPQGASFRIELDGIDVGLIIPTQTAPDRSFFGLLADAPFSQVKMYVASGTFSTYGLFDNCSFIIGGSQGGGGGGGGEEPPVGEAPDLATFVSLGTGLLFLGYRRRKIASA
jgi:hypothetical protein